MLRLRPTSARHDASGGRESRIATGIRGVPPYHCHHSSADFFLNADTDPQETSDPERLVADPLVSVLMITYNHAEFLGQAIAGVVEKL